MATLERLLARVAAEQRRAGERVAPGARPEAVAGLRADLGAAFDAELPEACARFLSLANGLDFDGLVLYRADAQASAGPGLVAANRLWRDLPANRGLLVLGDCDLDLFATAPDGSAPHAFDRVGGDAVERFADVETMLATLIARRLGA